MSDEVNAMFSSIAAQYDRANNILSLGIHHLWRSITVKESGAHEGMKVLDCATGTGDLAIAFKKSVGVKGQVVGVDFNRDMIALAKNKTHVKGLEINYHAADVLKLPFADNVFDITSIAFGIRNVDDMIQGLTEMARVTKSGGMVAILEFGQPGGIIGVGYRLYSRWILPGLGTVITGNKKAYQYLPETAARFPAGKEFVQRMEAASVFSSIRLRKLTHGIAWIYLGTVQ
ncbi:MAG: bifunctional demethylmenaquinone methyltransferase/2-methoxy-6-polyprenyl-1,4-benzoquinol methylase UbiE [Ignavibacteria bacterium]|nr:bifunctional demethylmenaquinone methyltransferase/2-methoxy-6-polyprenyl-1,4-benzoquinol methylase UbiE [Ignavibacteria bacterium]